MILLTESKNFKVVYTRKLKEDEKQIVTVFQQFLKIIYEFWIDKSKNAVTFEKLKRDLMPYYRYGFAKQIKEKIKSINDNVKRIKVAKSDSSIDSRMYSAKVADLEKAFS